MNLKYFRQIEQSLDPKDKKLLLGLLVVSTIFSGLVCTLFHRMINGDKGLKRINELVNFSQVLTTHSPSTPIDGVIDNYFVPGIFSICKDENFDPNVCRDNFVKGFNDIKDIGDQEQKISTLAKISQDIDDKKYKITRLELQLFILELTEIVFLLTGIATVVIVANKLK